MSLMEEVAQKEMSERQEDKVEWSLKTKKEVRLRTRRGSSNKF